MIKKIIKTSNDADVYSRLFLMINERPRGSEAGDMWNQNDSKPTQERLLFVSTLLWLISLQLQEESDHVQDFINHNASHAFAVPVAKLAHA